MVGMLVGLGSFVGFGRGGEVGVEKRTGGLGEGGTTVGMNWVGVAWFAVASRGLVGVGGELIGDCVGGNHVAVGKGH
jgi:hypothetical protein